MVVTTSITQIVVIIAIVDCTLKNSEDTSPNTTSILPSGVPLTCTSNKYYVVFNGDTLAVAIPTVVPSTPTPTIPTATNTPPIPTNTPPGATSTPRPPTPDADTNNYIYKYSLYDVWIIGASAVLLSRAPIYSGWWNCFSLIEHGHALYLTRS